ncbi:HPr family phosphocarrier protein [Bacillus carboniphilus]|uniref:HPr family phosphocarrier protein n=1 Tax=Bacillus carboniphilus TaxID=86663 RepID=A0ABY9JWQ5_9BACI|nr:HPr family phosphocarrier protein [Bacillus carboniphilus]WLR43837.1 HPr family phosphocarrier protein [Bacillus carboniphilus]
MKVQIKQPVFAETASLFVQTANLYSETILVKKEHWVVDAKSLLGILALSLQNGDIIEFMTESENDKLPDLTKLTELPFIEVIG